MVTQLIAHPPARERIDDARRAGARNRLIGEGDRGMADAWIAAWEARRPRTASSAAPRTGRRAGLDRRAAAASRPTIEGRGRLGVSRKGGGTAGAGE